MSEHPLGLFTDLYELTMAAAYHAEGRADEQATFDLFVRELPPDRDVLVACGLATALDRLDRFRYDDAALAYLGSLGLFTDDFLARLASLRVRGEVRAVAEGELVHPNEPLLSITGPILEAQLVETLLLNTVGFETMVATTAARIVRAAGGRAVVDFSARRDHGTDAALRAARAAYVGGAVGTSLVEAGRRYGLPVSGTMAHSYVMAHDHEIEAFRAFLRQYRERSVLLVDTYDTLAGVRLAIEAMDDVGVTARGIRIDSGDLAELAVAARAILDAAGRPGVQILASGDLDAERITELVAADVPIDAFGVGTRLGTSADAPYVGVVYKLVERDGRPTMKTSPGKVSLPGRKQVWRSPAGDVIAFEHEPGPAGARPLLATVWRDGVHLHPPVDLPQAQQRCRDGLASWGGPRPVATSAELGVAVAAGVAEAAARAADTRGSTRG